MRVRVPEDVLLPYMTDMRHADDTLFLVCEEDFRLFEADQPTQASLLWDEAQAHLLSQSPEVGGASASQDADPPPRRSTRRASGRTGRRGTRLQRKHCAKSQRPSRCPTPTHLKNGTPGRKSRRRRTSQIQVHIWST